MPLRRGHSTMSFPPNLGITNSFIIDSNCSLLFQEFPSFLPPLEQIYSPFSRTKMNGYSRIKESSVPRSKSVDFADVTLLHHMPRSKPNLCNEVKITTMHDSIPEHDQEDGNGEVFGVILGQKCLVSSAPDDQNMVAAEKSSSFRRSLIIKRSASVSEGYSRICHHSDLAAEEDDQYETEVSSNNRRSKKKKGKFFRVFRRLFGL